MSRTAFIPRRKLQALLAKAGADSPLHAMLAKTAKAAGTSRRDLEHEYQVQLFEWADSPSTRAEYPELEDLVAIPNGGFRTKRTAGRLKAEGVRAGYPDLVLDHARGGYHGWRGELKAEGGQVRASQKKRHARLRAAGYRVDVAIGWEAMRDAITTYLKSETTHA